VLEPTSIDDAIDTSPKSLPYESFLFAKFYSAFSPPTMLVFVFSPLFVEPEVCLTFLKISETWV
jgi:hypothetical protein